MHKEVYQKCLSSFSCAFTQCLACKQKTMVWSLHFTLLTGWQCLASLSLSLVQFVLSLLWRSLITKHHLEDCYKISDYQINPPAARSHIFLNCNSGYTENQEFNSRHAQFHIHRSWTHVCLPWLHTFTWCSLFRGFIFRLFLLSCMWCCLLGCGQCFWPSGERYLGLLGLFSLCNRMSSGWVNLQMLWQMEEWSFAKRTYDS